MNGTLTTAGRPRKTILIGAGAAIFVAAAALVLFILPAEFGIDPLGAGKAMGLTDLADTPMNEEQQRGALRTGVLTLSDEAPTRADWDDSWHITLAPFEAIEFKYTLPEDEAMDFSWQASAPLDYDMHAHPFEGGPELTESYSIEKRQQMAGRYVAAFTGLHGWYWQNRNMENVELTLEAAGGFTSSTIFDGPGVRERAIGGGEAEGAAHIPEGHQMQGGQTQAGPED